jgi:hypothetical protein
MFVPHRKRFLISTNCYGDSPIKNICQNLHKPVCNIGLIISLPLEMKSTWILCTTKGRIKFSLFGNAALSTVNITSHSVTGALSYQHGMQRMWHAYCSRGGADGDQTWVQSPQHLCWCRDPRARVVNFLTDLFSAKSTRSTKQKVLILCKIWGFHVGDYEDCHLLGYKPPPFVPHTKHITSLLQI